MLKKLGLFEMLYFSFNFTYSKQVQVFHAWMLKIIVMCHGKFELVSDAFRFNFEIKSNFERVIC
jgi:hypothetical protein